MNWTQNDVSVDGVYQHPKLDSHYYNIIIIISIILMKYIKSKLKVHTDNKNV